MPEDFFTRVPAWSKYKLDIFEKYLRIWSYHLQRRNNLLNYVDLCAGAGEYQDGTPGSPLIAAQTNDKYLEDLCRLQVIACERNEEAYEKLGEVMEPYTSRVPPVAQLFNKPYQDVLGEILQLTRRTPTFVFLDPFGIKSISADKLAPLLMDRAREPTELLVRVDPRLLARCSGWLNKKYREPRWQKTAKSHERLLQELAISDKLMAQYRQGKAGKGQRTSELFEDYIQLFESRFEYVHYLPIRGEFNQHPKYYLVFGTDSADGVALLNDAASTTEDDVYRNTVVARDGDQLHLMEPQRPSQVTITDAETVVLDILRDANGRLSFIKLRAELALRFGPDLRQKNHKRIVEDMEERGTIQLSPANQALSKDTEVMLASSASTSSH